MALTMGSWMRSFLVLSLAFGLPGLLGREFTSSDLDFIVAVQRLFCPESYRCDIRNNQSTTVRPTSNTTTSTNTSSPNDDVMSRVQVVPPALRDESCCARCSCDINTCYKQGTCCPDVLSRLPSMAEPIYQTQKCIFPQLKTPRYPGELPIASHTLMVYTKCPKQYKTNATSYQNATISKCEHLSLYDELDINMPVTDNTSFKVYRNRHCAYCHDVHTDNLLEWDILVQCIWHNYRPSNVSTMVQEVKMTEGCNIIYKPPVLEGMLLPVCDFAGVDSCNITGHWATYDAVIEAGCQAYTSIYSITYRNVFCYLCNTDNTQANTHCFGNPFNDVFVSFSAILNFKKDPYPLPDDITVQPKSQCNIAQLYDTYKNVCRDISCHATKRYVEGRCENIIQAIGGQKFDVFLKMTPVDLHGSSINVSDTVSAIETYMENFFRKLQIIEFISAFDIYIDSSVQVHFGDLEIDLGGIVTYFQIIIMGKLPISTETIDKLCSLSGNITVTAGNSSSVVFNVKLSSDHRIEDTYYVDERNEVLLDRFNSTHFRENQYAYSNEPPILLTRLYTCPRVALNASDFNITYLSWGITIEELKTNFSRSEFILNPGKPGMSDATLLLCCDTYADIVEYIQENQSEGRNIRSERAVQPQAVLSLICMCLSVLCALMTLGTYCLFKVLRTQPGVNNMALSISLICAQCLFQFGLGQANAVPDWACQVIGMLIHFCWLQVLLWMNVCSYHMFKVFSKTERSVDGTFRTTIRYCAYCTFAAAFFVILNIAISVSKHGNGQIGYGGNLCYITDNLMVGYLFAVPVATIIVTNLIMFIAVIIQLNRAPVLDLHSNTHRNYIKIYAKLSTITGAVWIFGFLYYFTEFRLLEYVFIVLNTGQGVFLFVAFVCNARVLKLYRELYLTSFKNIPLELSLVGSDHTRRTYAAHSSNDTTKL